MHKSFVRLATRLIAKNGRQVFLISSTGSGDPWDRVIVDAETPVTVVQVEYESREINGNTVAMGDKKFLMDSKIVPNNTMKIKDGDTEYSIVSIDHLQPGETSIMYTVQVRN